jgi:hypothetical protein
LKEKIERLSKGKFEYQLPFICLSEEEINIMVEAGKIQEGSFILSSNNKSSINGTVYSSNRLMHLTEPSFCGAENTIPYWFDATGLKPGEVIHGEFNVISCCGENSIPYTIQTEASYCMSTMGKISDLDQFTNLARMDWSEAKRVFRLEEFEQVILGQEDNYRFLYRNLIKSISTSQALEEFLIVIQKKETIRLESNKTYVEYDILQEAVTDKLTLTKNNWGYAEIRVSTDAPFIKLEQKFLWADRFIGNTYQVPFQIEPGYLKNGNNYGHIWIRTAYQTIAVQVLCKNKRKNRSISENKSGLRLEYGFINNYLDFRLNKIELTKYLERAGAIMERMPGPEVSYLKDLIRTQLAIISGKNALAEELLADFSKMQAGIRKKSVLEYCAYLYLEALHSKDDLTIKNAAETIRKFYDNGYYDWRILWFLLYTDKHYETNKAAKLKDMKEQFDTGCHSPILYYEAVTVFNEEPYLLRDLTDFEIQVMNYGIKNRILSKEAARQYIYLAGKKKKFDPLVFRGLEILYEKYDTEELLTAMISMLIKGLKKSERYFRWFSLGVEAQLRITELYEYYMYSISDEIQDMLPQPILLYFIYNSNLNDKKMAYLYANVIQYKERNEHIYRSYLKKMEVFAQKMIENHYINRDLAVLYNEFIEKADPGEEYGRQLPYVMYRQELICNNPNMLNAIVIHKETGMEETIPLLEGKAQVDIYTDHTAVLLSDSFGNRYINSVEYTLKPFMNAEDYESQCIKYSNHPMLLLHLYNYCQNQHILSEASIELRKNILKINGLAKEYVTECQQTLIEYYYENFDDVQLEYYINEIDLNYVPSSQLMKYIEFMIIRGFYTKALEAAMNFGFEGVTINGLVKLCSASIQLPFPEKEQQFLLHLCYYVFSCHKYDDAILGYLIQSYQGATKELYGLWRSARGFELECHRLEERLLDQMLFTETYFEESIPVFHTYYSNVTNRILVRAYLSYCAYLYLVHEREIDSELLQIMKRELFYEGNDICLLAWLKKNAFNTALSENDKVFAEYSIHYFEAKGRILPFFTQYQDRITLPERILNKYYITYHADPRNHIFIHYGIRGGSEQDYITEPMQDVFQGIHIKELVLFYHEEVQYYITEESEEGTSTTEVYNLSCDSEVQSDEESNYNYINQMLQTMEKQEDKDLQDRMERYVRKDYLIDACFKQIDE